MTSTGKRAHLAVAIFSVIFAALLLVATFYDLEVSRIMTRLSLKEGEYYTTDLFANFFEAAGMLPCAFIRAGSAIIVGWFFTKSFTRKALQAVVLLLMGAVAVYLLADGLDDVILYPMRHVTAENIEVAEAAIAAMKPTIYLISYVLAACIVALSVFLTRKVSLRTWSRLLLVALVCGLTDLIAGKTVSALKGYVDRVRFRSMNSVYGQEVGGFSLYTRWYEVTDHADLMRETPLVHYTDAFRSYPSGHTVAAASTYGLIALNDALEIRDKRIRAALWIVPITWTGLTAMGRIVAGAHFMSDVLFGGTIAFVVMILLREILVRRFATLKAMFPFRKKRELPCDPSEKER